MLTAALTRDEEARLALLDALFILDTPPQEEFDRITRMASRLLGVPISLVSLVAAHRQWFKSKVGLDVNETPRDLAFCAHAIHGRDPFIVPDASRDARFCDNPLVVGDPRIRFYAGVPLMSIDGVALGTLCVIDRQPRELSPEQIEMLKDLAAMVSRELHLRESINRARAHSLTSRDALARSEGLFRSVFEQAAVGVALVGLDGRWLKVNATLATIVGHSPQALKAQTFQDITHPDDLNEDMAHVARLLIGEIKSYAMEKRYIRADGQVTWCRLTVALVRDERGAPQYFVSVLEDINARKRAEAELARLHQTLESQVVARTADLHARQAELQAVLEHANDAYICTDAQGVICEWNKQAEVTFGWSRDEVLGRRLEEALVPADPDGERPEGATSGGLHLQDNALGRRRVEVRARRKDGRVIPVEISLGTLTLPSGRRYCAFAHDISERQALRDTLESEARRDLLTGLPNQRDLMAELPKAMARAERSGQHMAVLLLDLDGFKAINDAHGRDKGNLVLTRFANRLKGAVRETDMVARLSGDQFVVLFEGIFEEKLEPHVVPTLFERTRTVLQLDGQEVRVSASIGVYIHVPGAHETPDDVLAAAGKAMHEVKRVAKGARSEAA